MKYFSFLSSVLIFLTSCRFNAPLVQYTPSMVNVPTTAVKGEWEANLIYTTGRDPVNDLYKDSEGSNYKQKVNGIQLQTALAIKDNIALQVNNFYSGENNSSFVDSIRTEYNYKRYMSELGLTIMQKTKQKDQWIAAISFGAGLGKNQTTEVSTISAYVPFYNHKLFKVFLQPSFSKKSSNFYFVFGTKFSYLNFNTVNSNFTNLEKTNKGLFTGNSSNNFVLDYYMQLAYYLPGTPGIGFNMQFMYTANLTQKMNNNLNNFNFGIGCCYKLHTKSKPTWRKK